MKTREEWIAAFAQATHGHTNWDGNAPDPHDPSLAYSTAHDFVDYARTFGFFLPQNTILDLGCGNGRFAICFADMPVRYIGLDVLRESIQFCNNTFAGYPHLKFGHLDVRNAWFNPSGSLQAETLTLPFRDECLDDIIAYSIFTHLQTKIAAKRYMQEIHRVLKPGGKLFTSWYRNPPNPESTYIHRTCYKECDIMSYLQGFMFDYTCGGHSSEYYDQWALYATKLYR